MPSSHSGSSHSSSSHSSSSHSSGGFSSHSSSSHSSSSWGSSWGSSRSSRSSRSSSRGPSGSLWGSLRDPVSGPSRHSAGSHSSSPTIYKSHYVRSGSMRGSVIDRPRYNQPRGYTPSEHHNVSPIPHYCVHHNYFYYPLSWTDEATGQEYKRGYYDENGQYYENVVFQTDGVYKNVICQCEYCDTISKIDWTEGGPLICPQCGGTMKILSALDEYTQDPNYEKNKSIPSYVDYADRGSYVSGSSGGSTLATLIKCILIIVGVILAVVVLMEFVRGSRYQEDDFPIGYVREDGGVYQGNGSWVWFETPGNNVQEDPPSNPELFNSVIYLNDVAPGVGQITGDYNHDRELIWDESEESYHDPDSDLWAWYNTDVYPNLWQYWYEPISQDYGDYGWMEWEDGVWYIEADRDEWIQVPDQYDTSPLWHIEYHGEDAENSHTIPLHVDDSSENISNPDLFNEIIYLERVSDDSYVITGNVEHDLEPVWQQEEQSYYEVESGMWLWYNTDVEPNLWQYWYEPISQDFGNYGWMEWEDGTWYIEANAGDWIPLPEEYDTSPLWHIVASDSD